MADWASKVNYNNPLFTIYHTLQFAKHKGMYWEKRKKEKKFTNYYGHECENTFGMPLVHHRAEMVPGMLKIGLFSGVLSPCVILRSSACTFCHTGMFCRRVPKNVSLFSSNIVIHTSSSLDVCIGVCECTRALCCVVLLSPLQIRIKMNLFCILGRLQGHRCQLCQI